MAQINTLEDYTVGGVIKEVRDFVATFFVYIAEMPLGFQIRVGKQ